MQLFGFTAQNSTTPMLKLGLIGPRFLRAAVPDLQSKTKKAARYKVSSFTLQVSGSRLRAPKFVFATRRSASRRPGTASCRSSPFRNSGVGGAEGCFALGGFIL